MKVYMWGSKLPPGVLLRFKLYFIRIFTIITIHGKLLLWGRLLLKLLTSLSAPIAIITKSKPIFNYILNDILAGATERATNCCQDNVLQMQITETLFRAPSQPVEVFSQTMRYQASKDSSSNITSILSTHSSKTLYLIKVRKTNEIITKIAICDNYFYDKN